MRMKTLIAGLFAATLALPALASEPAKTTWSGVWVGGFAGMDMTSTEVSVPTFLSIDGLSGNGMVYGLAAGADLQVPGTRFVVGIGGDWARSDSDFTVTITGLPTLLRAGIDESWSVYGRVGLDMGRIMPYVLAGYSEADVSAHILGTKIGSDTMKGWLVGGGMEMAIGMGAYIGAEYRYTMFDTLAVIPTFLNADTDRHEVRATLKYKFSGMF